MVRRIRSGQWTFNTRLSNPAISTRTCGTVKAGVCIFSPPGLLCQEPASQQRQALMVVPALPCPHLIVAQTCFALGPLQAILHAMLRLVHPCELPQRVACYLVGQQVVVFERPVAVLLAEDHQRFRHGGTLALRLGLYQGPDRLYHQRSLLTVTN